MLWIGARSTVSPFIVQEIADALQGTDRVVLVKNTVNPDLALWLGGIERLYAANIKKLGVVHRGFSTYEKHDIATTQMADSHRTTKSFPRFTPDMRSVSHHRKKRNGL